MIIFAMRFKNTKQPQFHRRIIEIKFKQGTPPCYLYAPNLGNFCDGSGSGATATRSFSDRRTQAKYWDYEYYIFLLIDLSSIMVEYMQDLHCRSTRYLNIAYLISLCFNIIKYLCIFLLMLFEIAQLFMLCLNMQFQGSLGMKIYGTVRALDVWWFLMSQHMLIQTVFCLETFVTYLTSD